MKRTIVVLLVGAWIAIAPAAHAQEFTSTHTDCSGLELFAAAGVPDGATHKYQFRGICRELEKDDGNKVVSVRWQGWVEVDSRYDVKTAEFDEGVKITMAAGYDGPQSGTIEIRLKCAQDPMLTSSSCTIMQFAQKATWPDFVTAWKKNAPYTKGKVTYAQAAELSKLATSNPPPPPPPPPAGDQKSASRDEVALPAVQAPVTQPPAGQPKQRTTPIARPAPAPLPPPETTRLALPPLPPG
ncbi:MAG TPA: hypothetical protein VK939_04160, partial [Longimicrobiales bacterium]|nr:hypothetical protein [Longimicrobiales bacterium]